MVIDIPDIGLGTYENTDPEVCAESVETALNVGYRHVDTAEMYDNERAVGAGLARADVDRGEVFLSTKIHSSNLAYDDVFESAQGCLDRLGVEYVDLLYVHWPIRSYDSEGTLAAFDDLREEGLIRNVGLSNFTPELLDEATDLLDASLFAHQVECHPLLQQEELRARARRDDHYLVAYSPLAKGEVFDVPELVDIAERHGATPAQVGLAWLRSKENVVAIPKSSSEGHIRENLQARELSLTDDDIARIDAIDRERRQVDFAGAPWNH
ncbi:aldo/keto reductase (plasmid) [Halorussus salilacus]|uniref:aldo/keto reductase n=1 Tax=Halorussus salilacus TaxID=2953750 RepID=UPI00209DDA2F|nr:aldo/keto reductase [Halorussus salilacus]USZ69834.1 aldo/keto reductase [Halorussus salilacus]